MYKTQNDNICKQTFNFIVFKENARYPYLATVILDGMQYGIGIGSSKKLAKLDAARATLEVLLPTVKNHIQINRRHAMNERPSNNNFDENTVSIFSTILRKLFNLLILPYVKFRFLTN